MSEKRETFSSLNVSWGQMMVRNSNLAQFSGPLWPPLQKKWPSIVMMLTAHTFSLICSDNIPEDSFLQMIQAEAWWKLLPLLPFGSNAKMFAQSEETSASADTVVRTPGVWCGVSSQTRVTCILPKCLSQLLSSGRKWQHISIFLVDRSNKKAGCAQENVKFGLNSHILTSLCLQRMTW